MLSTVLVYTQKRYRVIGETRLGYTKIFHGILQSLCTYFADLKLYPQRQEPREPGVIPSLEVRNLFIKYLNSVALFENYAINQYKKHNLGNENGFIEHHPRFKEPCLVHGFPTSCCVLG